MSSKDLLRRILAIVLALLTWQAAAMIVGLDLLLVSPVTVLKRLGTIWLEPDFWQALGFSLSRIAAGFGLAFIFGTLAAFAAGRFRLIETLLWPYMAAIKSVPVASFIIIALIWLSARQLSVFISFLMVFPILYANVLQGIRSTDPRLLEMAALYKVPWRRRLHYIYLPQIKPYLISASSVALGLSWKAGIAAEVIGVAQGSIGEKLYESKIYFLTADLFAWTVVIVLVSVLFEKAVTLLLRRGFRELEKK